MCGCVRLSSWPIVDAAVAGPKPGSLQGRATSPAAQAPPSRPSRVSPVLTRARCAPLSSEYRQWQLGVVADALGLRASAGRGGSGGSEGARKGLQLCDVGGGTGAFTAALAEISGLGPPPLVVDPSAAMLAAARQRGGGGARLETLQAGALEFSRSPRPADLVLLKEVAHHLEGDAEEVLSGLYQRCLRPGGRLVVVTRPEEPTVALFEAAKEVWRTQQPSHRVYVDALHKAGCAGVRAKEVAFHVTMPARRWAALLKTRFWSTLSAAHFDDAALDAGCSEALQAAGGEEGTAEFDDTLVLVIADKPAATGGTPS